MPLAGTAPRVYRLQTLLRQYLNTEIDAIDTEGDGYLGSSEDFTTPSLADEDIQVFREDREAECITVVIVPEGTARSVGELTKHGPGTNQSRWTADHSLSVYVTAKSSTGSWGEHGAWLRADRVAHGVTACLLKWPSLNVPALSLEKLALWSEIDGWERLPTEEKDETLAVTLVGSVSVRTMEQIA